MKSNEVGTTLKHPETINGNVKNLSKRMKMKDKGECHFKNVTFTFNLSKRMKMKDKGECHFYFKNLALPLITTLSCTPKHLTTPTSYLGFRETSPLESPRPGDVGNASPASPTLRDVSPWNTGSFSKWYTDLCIFGLN
jgi:hypothetical protein